MWHARFRSVDEEKKNATEEDVLDLVDPDVEKFDQQWEEEKREWLEEEGKKRWEEGWKEEMGIGRNEEKTKECCLFSKGKKLQWL